MQVLLLNFNSNIYVKRERNEKACYSGRIRADWIASIGNLIELERKREGKGKLEVRFHSEHPNLSLIIVDDWTIQSNHYEPAGIGGKRGFGHSMDLWLNLGEYKETFQEYHQTFTKLWDNESTIRPDLLSFDLRSCLPANLDYKILD